MRELAAIIQLDFEVRRKMSPAAVIATGRYVLVCVRQGDFAPVPVPEELRRRIAGFLENGTPAGGGG